MGTYQKVKTFLEESNNLAIIRNISIELLDNQGDYESSYQHWKNDIDKFLNSKK